MVDDDPLICMDAVGMLEDAGFEVLDAPNVELALGLLREHHPRLTLLFTDVQMPGEHDGFHLAREVARCWPHISIVVASGQANPTPGDMPQGASFISKPFSAGVVHDALRQIVPEHRRPKPLRG
ncbi:response regulator [Lichenibacterium ramalinae]|uniref:response regulator n=1 Tax=Lichenibacterium ramalinae TaxID=2316527 RepID=UPI00315D8092